MKNYSRILASSIVALIVGSGGTAGARPYCPGSNGEPCDPCIENPDLPHCRNKPPVSGTLRPKYLILTIVYAPPGTAGTGTKSTVTYGSASTTGVSVSSSHSFKSEVSLSATFGLGDLLKLGVNGSFSSTSTDGSSIDIKKTSGLEIAVSGSGSDGIDHDRDIIYLWLNPTVAVVARDKKAQWALGTDGAPMDIQFAYVGWLKNPSTMPPGLADRFKKYGITDQDIKTMLAQDPFASGATSIDPQRFQQTVTTFPYEPPYQQGDPVQKLTLTLKNDTTTTASSSWSLSYSVGYSVDMGGQKGIPLTDWLSLFGSSKSTWTWTDTTSLSTSSNGSQSAVCSVTGPSYGYTGPTDIAVYWDNAYGSFMFSPIVDPPMVVGKVVDESGHPVANKEVLLKVSARKSLRTFTDARGQYRFRGKLSGAANVTIDGQQIPVVMSRTPRTMLFKLHSWIEP